jgi:sugar O-acyltransferase (sialic acid O-acetyltransferase NeuD family)
MSVTYIIGAGGHGKVVGDALLAAGHEVAGFLDADLSKVGKKIFGIDVLEQDELLKSIDPNVVELANGIGDLTVRRALYDRLSDVGFIFKTVIHPSAIIARDVSIGQGSQVMAGCVIQTGVQVAENALINTCCSVDHDSIIGASAFLGPGVTLCGNVSVGLGAHIGTGATVLEKVSIGDHSVVGGGSTVIDIIANCVTAVGVPARVIKQHKNSSQQQSSSLI